MTRVIAFLVHNWPLKLAALVLATLLYGIVVVAQDSRIESVRVPIQPANQPDAIAVLSPLGDVTRIRYLAPPEVIVTSESFQATVDLGAPGVGKSTKSIAVDLVPNDPRIDVVDYEPRRIGITLDDVVSATVPITVEMGPVPSGLDPRRPQLDAESAEVRGAESAVRRVDEVIARVDIPTSGINVDRVFDLIPVDSSNEEVPEVDVEPSSMRVRIAVLNDAKTKIVTVTPVLTGTPAPGFELAGVAVVPPVVTVEGDGEQMAALSSAPTASISLDGATETFDQPAALELPTGVLALDRTSVTVTVTIRPVTATRTFTAGLTLEGPRADRRYALSTDQVLVTVGGSTADLGRLEGRTFQVDVPVAGLDVGEHEVTLGADLPAGLTVVSIRPESVTVTVSLPPPPAASPTPSATTP